MLKITKFIFVADFSLSEWAERIGADIGQQIGSEFRQLLIEQLGLDVFLKKPRCERNSSLYTAAIGGWKNGVLICSTKDNCLLISEKSALYLIHTSILEGTCQPGMCHLTLTSFSWSTDC
jgi:hypothetical protein